MVARYERILNLISALLDAREPLPLEQIRETVIGYEEGTESAVRRRFERDKQALREMGLGLRMVLPLGGSSGGYVIERASLILDPLELSPEESRMLALVGRHFPVEPDSALAASLQSALLKIQLASPGTGELPPAPRAESAARCDPQVYDALARAALEGRRVTLRYRALDGAGETQRSVDPYGLGFYHGLWYLVGRCHLRQAIRTFRLSQIVEPPKLDARPAAFSVPEEFRLEDHLDRRSWEIGRGDECCALIHFDAEAFWCASRPFRDEDLEPADDGSGCIRARYVDPDRLLGWLHGFGRHARIVGPPELVERERSFHQQVARRHAGSPAVPPSAAPPAEPAQRASARPAHAADTSRLSRILTLIPFLARHPGIGVDEVSRLCGIPPAAILDDLCEILMCGLPPYLPDDYIGVYIEDGRITLRWADHFSSPTQLSLTEALALRLALDRVLGAGDERGRVLRDRIESVLPPGLAPHLQALSARIRVAAGESGVMAPLLEALARGVKVETEYYALSSGELSRRVVQPYGLVERAGALYLVGWCELRAEVRSFHTGRFRSVALLDQPFERPDELPETPIQGGAGEPALIYFDPPLVQRIRDTFEPGEYELTAGGGALLRLRLVSPRWLIAWLMSLGPAFEVLAPRSLREELAALA